MYCFYWSIGCRLLWICYDAINWCCNFTAETEPHEGKRKVESLWPIFRLHHQRSRYIFDLFYKRKAISRGMVVGCSLVVFVSMWVVTNDFHSQSFMIIAPERVMQTRIWLPNGKNRAMKTCAVCGAFRRATQTLEQIAYAEFLRASLKW